MEIENLSMFIWRDTRTNNCNTYLIDGPAPVLIDPGHTRFFQGVCRELVEAGFDPQRLALALNTHGHPDHVEGSEVFTELNAYVAIHEKEYEFIEPLFRTFYQSQGIAPPDIVFDLFLREGEITSGDHTFEILHTPGHSPGSVCVYWPAKRALFSGDVIFKQGVGRTDLPGGSVRDLAMSIQRLRELDVELLLPGHGEPVEGKEEVERNFEMATRQLNFM
ncbi:MAG: MBL fold metallo-hydrolase [Desulfatibacillaceae bacterium]